MKRSEVSEAYSALWAKTGDPPHPLLAHFLDAAAVAWAILEREPVLTRSLYAQDWGVPEQVALRLAAFLSGLHDLGKASPVFQSAWPEGAARVWSWGLTWNEELVKESWVAHGVLTDLYLRDALRQVGFPRRTASSLAEALGAHHGFAAGERERQLARLHMKSEPPPWREARRCLVEKLAQVLGLHLPPHLERENPTPSAILRVMALASIADWIASDQVFFPYGRDPSTTSYWTEALTKAREALECLPWPRPSTVDERPFEALFPFPPNALQVAVPRLLKEANEPVLILVEAPMGLGKTEAALYAYHLLQGRMGHRGLYLALPTQATANGLFLRVKSFLERLGQGERLELQLQHGAAILNPKYMELLERARPRQVYDPVYNPNEGIAVSQDTWEGTVAASAWFSAKKRAMLAGYGVGTLDQALLGVLKVKHHFIRLWGLMNRVVVLDEVHAYDTYTTGLLLALLRWLRALGSSVVLMTATLPKAKRAELLAAWGTSPGDLPPYPRVAAFEGERFLGAESLRLEKAKRVSLRGLPVMVEGLARALRERLPGVFGAIVNTVDRAQALYRALGAGERLTLADLLDLLGENPREGPWEDLWEARQEKGAMVVGKRLSDATLVFLLHARFPAEERALREAVAMSLFGKHGPRPERAVLVATQVAEQSLDLDFDLLYSDLAPIDLLFQRMGRLHRHERQRPEGHSAPVLLVGGLDWEPEFGEALYWNKVYEDYLLLSTWFSLQGREEVRVPDDLESLLEEVYGRLPEIFPEELQKRAEQSHKKLVERWEKEARTAENFSLSDLDRLLSDTDTSSLAAAFHLDDDGEDEKTQRLLTRLGEPSVPVVPLFPAGEEYFLDPEGKRPARLSGELSREEALTLWARAVRLSRPPIPDVLRKSEAPSAWRKSGLLRGIRPLEVGSVFRLKRGALVVELDPELGVVYRYVLIRQDGR